MRLGTYIQIGVALAVALALAVLYGMMKDAQGDAAFAEAARKSAVLEKQVAEADRDTALKANDELYAAAQDLQEALTRANRINAQFITKLDAIAAEQQKQSETISALETSDEPTKLYMDTDVPDALRLQFQRR